VLALIYDTSNRWTDLATIDFSLSQVTYKRTFPLMPGGMLLGVFMSDTLYYVGSYDDTIY
jgi:hypothetical protein